MGCDIHLHTEVKIDGIWHHYGSPHIRRSYALFSKIADVRNCGDEPNPLTPHPGLPSDATELTKLSRLLEDGDCEGWIDTRQIKELAKWFEDKNPYDPWGLEGVFDFVFQNGWAGIPNENVEDARFIFWFD